MKRPIEKVNPRINKELLKLILALLVIVLTIGCKNENGLPDPLEAGWNNEAVCEVLKEDAKIRVLKCTFPPGVGHEKHYHDRHVGYTISGSKFRIEDTTGVREVNVPTGYTFSKDERTWHEVLNVGDSTAIFLIIEPK